MNRKISLGMAVTIVILAMTVTFSITMLIAMRLFDSTVNSVKEKESMYNKIAEVDRYVRSNDYYTIDEATLYDRLTAGYLLGTGDKYARYYTANAYTELMNIQSGKILGIGVELGIDQTGYAKVTRVYDGSPAQEAGIAVGDYITTVGDTDVKSLSGADAVYKALQGEAGTTVTVTWLDSSAASKTAELTHSGYTSTTVDYQLLDNVGYIRIRQFDGTTPSELDYALRTLTANGAASLVFDLRDNGGGILEDAINCIDLIAPEGTVAYAEDKNGNRTVVGSSDAESAMRYRKTLLRAGQPCDHVAGEQLFVCIAHFGIAAQCLSFVHVRILFLSTGTLEDEQVESHESRPFETQRLRSVRHRVGQVGTRPVQYRHEVVGDAVNAAPDRKSVV